MKDIKTDIESLWTDLRDRYMNAIDEGEFQRADKYYRQLRNIKALLDSKSYNVQAYRTLHIMQEKILKLVKDGEDISKMTLRQIGEKIGSTSPQQVKHHIVMLQKRGLI